MARQLIKNIGGVRQGKVVSDELLIECAIVHADATAPAAPASEPSRRAAYGLRRLLSDWDYPEPRALR